jgi:DedD protein
MDSELKQRLIGAAVVTALAAIFIPMLFDDPVTNSGQMVSELVIPTTPNNPDQSTANKLSTNLNQVAKKPAHSSAVVETAEEAELSATPRNIAVDNSEQAINEAEDDPTLQDEGAIALDTGVVEEAAQPNGHAPITVVKKPDKKPNEPVQPLVPPAAEALPKTIKPPELMRWSVQAGSFGVKENAQALQDKLRKQGLPVVMEAIKSAKGTIYRLKVGASLDKTRASSMKSALDKQNIKAIMVPE